MLKKITNINTGLQEWEDTGSANSAGIISFSKETRAVNYRVSYISDKLKTMGINRSKKYIKAIKENNDKAH